MSENRVAQRLLDRIDALRDAGSTVGDCYRLLIQFEAIAREADSPREVDFAAFLEEQ
jgi:hypothetical protein